MGNKPCTGCPFSTASTIKNPKAVEAKLNGLKKVKSNLNIEFMECHNNRKSPCKGMIGLKVNSICQ